MNREFTPPPEDREQRKLLLEEHLRQAGIYVPELEQRLIRATGVFTDIPDVIDYSRLVFQSARIPVAELMLTEDILIQDIYGTAIQQLTGKRFHTSDNPYQASSQFDHEIHDVPHFNFIVSMVPGLSEGIEERNSAIRSFANNVRSYVQYRGTKLVVYSEDPKSVPPELKINIPFLSRRTSR